MLAADAARRAILAACLAACTGRRRRPCRRGRGRHPCGAAGWHAELGLPAPALFQAVPALRPPFGADASDSSVRDRAYLQARDGGGGGAAALLAAGRGRCW